MVLGLEMENNKTMIFKHGVVLNHFSDLKFEIIRFFKLRVSPCINYHLSRTRFGGIFDGSCVLKLKLWFFRTVLSFGAHSA